MSLGSHIVASFDRDLKGLDDQVIREFTLVRLQIQNAVTAVVQLNVSLAERVVQGDGQIDALDLAIETETFRILALRGPMAEDLRWVVASRRVSFELERMGNLGKGMARRVALFAQDPISDAVGGLRGMAHLVLSQLDRMRTSWVNEDAALALSVWHGDEAVDAIFDSLLRELLTHMMESSSKITSCTHLLFIAKNLERIGDHVSNIAEVLHYRCTGQKLVGSRVRSTFLDTLSLVIQKGESEVKDEGVQN